MSSVNKVIIIGRLGADPDMVTLQDGTVLANLRVATTASWTDKGSGEQREETEWHNVVLRGRTAEVARDYLKKGSLVYIDGSLRTRKWQDKEGRDRYTTEIRGYGMQMLGNPPPKDGKATQPPAMAKHTSVDEDIPF